MHFESTATTSSYTNAATPERQVKMSCVRFKVSLGGPSDGSLSLSSSLNVGAEVDFKSLVHKHLGRNKNSSSKSSYGSESFSSRPAKRMKPTLVSGASKKSSSIASSNGTGSHDGEQVAENETKEAGQVLNANSAGDLSVYDNLPLDSVIGPGQRGGLSAIIEKIERSYANPLYFAPSSDGEDFESSVGSEGDEEEEEDDDEDDEDDEDGDIDLENEDDLKGNSLKGLSKSSDANNASNNGKKKLKGKAKKKKVWTGRRGDYYYQSDDSFIDDSELVHEKEKFFEQQQSKTHHSGFFVNAGEIMMNEEDMSNAAFGAIDSNNARSGSMRNVDQTESVSRRDDFIKQHLGKTWDGCTSDLKEEFDMFMNKARFAAQNDTTAAIRLPEVLEVGLSHLDTIVRSSTKARGRPPPFIAALMNIFPTYSKNKVIQTLIRIRKKAVAVEKSKMAQDAKIAIEQHLQIRLREPDAFISSSGQYLNPEDNTQTKARYNWIPNTQMLLYSAMLQLKEHVAKENEYREKLTKTDIDVLGADAAKQLDLKVEEDALLTHLVGMYPAGIMSFEELRENVELGKTVYEQDLKNKAKEKEERNQAEQEMKRQRLKELRSQEKAAKKAALKKKRMEEREQARKERALQKELAKKANVPTKRDKKIAAFTKKYGPRKARNAYNFFQKYMHIELGQKEPELNLNQTEKMMRIAYLWSTISAEQKAQWELKSTEDKGRFKKEYEIFKVEKLDPFVQRLSERGSTNGDVVIGAAGAAGAAGAQTGTNSGLINSKSIGDFSSASSVSSVSSDDGDSEDSAEDDETEAEREFNKRMKEFEKREAPKRCSNSYLLFMVDRRPSLIRERPELEGNMSVASAALGKLWKELPASEKKPFHDKAAALRIVYDAAFKKYKQKRLLFETELRAHLGLPALSLKKNKSTSANFLDTLPFKSKKFDMPDFNDSDFEEYEEEDY